MFVLTRSPHHDEFGPSNIAYLPAPFPAHPKSISRFLKAEHVPVFEERNNDGLSKDPDIVIKPRTCPKKGRGD